MSAYSELCTAYYQYEPRRIAIHSIIENLPRRMVSAIQQYLAVPSFYVESQKESDDADELLFHDDDGKLAFTVRIMATKNGEMTTVQQGTIFNSFMRFSLRIEETEIDHVVLSIKNAAPLIRIDNPEADLEYIRAAEAIIGHVVTFLRKPPMTTARSAIGFI